MTTQTVERVTHSGKRTIQMESLARVERYKSRTSTSVISTPGVDFSLTNCIQKLEAIDDISEEVFVKAVGEFKNQDSREAFIAMSCNDLFILGHNIRHRVVADRFQHSTETVQRHFKQTIKALRKLGREIIKQDSTELPDHIVNNLIFYPWFHNCLGAIDGTHISAWAPAEKQASIILLMLGILVWQDFFPALEIKCIIYKNLMVGDVNLEVVKNFLTTDTYLKAHHPLCH
ncbi:hypothetical protein Tsubulata_006001, partial [Turnera subulata]